jgi:RES domain-containing protein
VRLSAWRIVKLKHAAAAFSGEGARLYGGRWNSPGTRMVYAAGSTSLAILEMLIHLQSDELLQRYVVFEVTFDDKLLSDLPAVPKSWRRSPPPASVQRLGDEWVRSGPSAVLRVPSVVVPKEWNYLMNPTHADFGEIHVGARQPLKFDPRLNR